MKNKAILIVAGEPNSIFLEIFFKSLINNNFKTVFYTKRFKRLTHKTNEAIKI